MRFPRVHTEGSAIPTLWAREKIEDLQSQDWNGAQQGTPNAAIRDQIVGVALDYRLMSQYTSFVAVEERVVNVGGQNRRIDVPVELTDGVAYEGIFEQQRGRGTAASRVARRPSLLSLGVQGKAPGAGGGFGGGLGGAALPPAASPAPTRPPARPELAPTLSEEKEGLRDGSLKRASTPQERRAQLADQKLAPALRLLVQPAPASPLTGILPARVERGRVTIQLWVRNLPADGLQKLKALGFALSAELRPGVLVLGTLPVTSLAKVVELEWVQRVEPPAFR
ncbi:MAG: hypothetical protein FJX77_07480 [Armatimonadetes bacterium]|nr:hypothetical protein [Armatimonadota bacterium]